MEIFSRLTGIFLQPFEDFRQLSSSFCNCWDLVSFWLPILGRNVCSSLLAFKIFSLHFWWFCCLSGGLLLLFLLRTSCTSENLVLSSDLDNFQLLSLQIFSHPVSLLSSLEFQLDTHCIFCLSCLHWSATVSMGKWQFHGTLDILRHVCWEFACFYKTPPSVFPCVHSFVLHPSFHHTLVKSSIRCHERLLCTALWAVSNAINLCGHIGHVPSFVSVSLLSSSSHCHYMGRSVIS